MKKQIAVLMAAATAVTTVAPVLANADVNTDTLSVAQITDKVRKALDTKYDANDMDGIRVPNGTKVKDVLNSRYLVLTNAKDADTKFDTLADSAYKKYDEFSVEVEEDDFIGMDNEDWYVVDDASKLGIILEADETAKVSIIDKGIEDGKSYRETEMKYYVEGEVEEEDDQISLDDAAEVLFNSAKASDDDTTFVDTLEVNGEKIVDDKEQVGSLPSADVYKIELTLTSGEEITLEAGDDAFDFSTARNAAGDQIKLSSNGRGGYSEGENDADVLEEITTFDVEENDSESVNKVDIGNGDTDVYEIKDVTEEVMELNNIYTREDGYNDEGADFVNGLIGAAFTTAPNYQFNFRGTTYQLAEGSNDVVDSKEEARDAIKINESDLIRKDGSGYKLVFDVNVIDKNDTAIFQTLQFVIKGDKQADLFDVLRDLRAGVQNGVEVVAGHFTKLAGSNRYATAIAVSGEQFDAETADSVVIVGGEANLDGLAAAPLASAKNAPILLADKNKGLSKATINEIDRACKSLKRRNVYIVGGENSVPASVEKQLEEEFGAVVIRLSGSNRYSTSLEVARRLSYDDVANNRIFVVGGNGEADAMSVAPVAATKNEGKVSPIVVVRKEGLDRGTREFLGEGNNNLEATEAYIVGGEHSLSTQVYRDLGYVGTMEDRTRLAGDNRYDTNFEIIEEFYTNDDDKDGIKVDGAIYASGANQSLVDAMAAGSFAASKNSPIILAGRTLTGDQTDMLKSDGLLDGQRSGIYQVGGVVSADVMQTVVDKLEL